MSGPWRMVLVPAVITLAVTLLRLFAELQGWSAVLASNEGGAPGALLGIAWLMFVFGGWFGFRLAKPGAAPERPGRATLWMLALAFLAPALGFSMLGVLGGEEEAFPHVVAVNAVIYVAAAAFAYRLWPALGGVNLRYGVLARAPILVLTVIAVLADWGTHYEKVGPGEGLDLPAWERIAWLCFAQVFVWIPFTVLFGGFAGAFVAWIKLRPGRPMQVPP